MSDASSVSLPLNIYEEYLSEDTTLNLSSKNLETLPEIKNNLLCVVYLQNNKLTTLPDNFFPSLPSLMWLDLRDNCLTDIPRTIKNHPSLSHLLLQNNRITSLPDELGTVNLKLLQLNGNPLMYPPRDIINDGRAKILKFLHDKYIDNIFIESHSDLSEEISPKDDSGSTQEVRSYNSVIDDTKSKPKNLSVQFSEKELDDSDEEQYSKLKGKCPKLAKSRCRTIPAYYQSAKYVKPLFADGRKTQEEKIKQNYLKEAAIKKHKALLANREVILQERRNAELLRCWRKNYRHRQYYTDPARPEPSFPYDTNPEYMTLLSREDIEKDLPDKYRKSLTRRSKPSVPRKSNKDVHLAIRIKQLFENLEAIDLNRQGMTPRTEQKVLLNEIQKISEIKQKLMELSSTNQTSFGHD